MRRLTQLAYRGRYAIGAAVLVLVTLLIIVTHPAEPFVRCSGTTLLVSGQGLILLQLLSVARAFNHPGPITGALGWMQSLGDVLFPRPPIIMTAKGMAVGVSGTAGVGLKVTRANPDLATQLADLRREFEDRAAADDARHIALVARINKESEEGRAHVQTVEARLSALGGQLHSLAVGDFTKAVVGLGLTVIGTFTTGFAPEIAAWVAG